MEKADICEAMAFALDNAECAFEVGQGMSGPSESPFLAQCKAFGPQALDLIRLLHFLIHFAPLGPEKIHIPSTDALSAAVHVRPLLVYTSHILKCMRAKRMHHAASTYLCIDLQFDHHCEQNLQAV